ncbi:MAG TPA: hypothetical protein PLP21_02940 [Pyrinomonadaceae bacterium]|nr:hypothetical protein [Acidobacteriota bacterium]HQZ95243.1 hypothetical protein [Pyrinomonadaceae bacterium]
MFTNDQREFAFTIIQEKNALQDVSLNVSFVGPKCILYDQTRHIPDRFSEIFRKTVQIAKGRERQARAAKAKLDLGVIRVVVFKGYW